jgi:hypothetical protein
MTANGGALLLCGNDAPPFSQLTTIDMIIDFQNMHSGHIEAMPCSKQCLHGLLYRQIEKLM